MYDCNDCMEFFAKCPCCDMEFCPKCGKTDSDQDSEIEDD